MGGDVLAAVLVAVALLIAVVAVVSSRRSKPKGEVRVIQPEGGQEPVVVGDPSGIVFPAEEAERILRQAGGDDELDSFTVLWNSFHDLFRGKSRKPALKGLLHDGVFSDRRIRFTLVHVGTLCVVVRANPPTAIQVRRYVIDTTERRAWMRSEPRQRGENDRSIAPAQTRDTGTEGMRLCDEATLRELWDEFQNVRRVGML